MIYGKPLPERLNKFNQLVANPSLNSITKWDVPTNNGAVLYDVYYVSIELPKYRLDNTRTLALQEQHIHANKLKNDFFDDVESDIVQEVQHGLLKSLIKSGDRDKDLLNYFTTHTQTEPLILTHDGFVISGNRRLCALRELVNSDYNKFRHFAEIRVVVLQNYDPDKIDQIEDFLEQQQDIKEPFSWVSRALGYRRRIERYNYSDEQLATITGTKKSEIRGLIDRLDLADRYLDSVNCPKDYNQILDDYYAFDKIYSCQIKDKGSPSSKVAFEELAFLSLKNKNKFADRMYKNIPVMFEVKDKIHKELRGEFANEIQEMENQDGTKVRSLGLKVLPDPNISLIHLIKNHDFEERIIEIITNQIDEHIALERDRRNRSSVLDRVRKSNTLLIEANAIKSHEANKDGILQQIENIEKELEKLRNWATSE